MWRSDALVTLELPNENVVSTWDEVKDALARHQVDEILQTAVTKTDDPDLFDIED